MIDSPAHASMRCLQDPLTETQAAISAAIQERNESVRTYERERAKHQEDPAYEEMMLRAAQFLEVQNGARFSLVSEPLQQIITEDMEARAADLAAQNAEPVPKSAKADNKKSSQKDRKKLRFGGAVGTLCSVQMAIAALVCDLQPQILQEHH